MHDWHMEWAGSQIVLGPISILVWVVPLAALIVLFFWFVVGNGGTNGWARNGRTDARGDKRWRFYVDT